MKELWDLFRDRDALMFVGVIIWSGVSCVIVTILWAKCWRSEADEVDDGIFIMGHALSTASCFGFMFSYLLTILPIEGKEKNAPALTGLAFVVGLLGILILPFGHIRMKWLSLVACSTNVAFLFCFAFFYAD